MRCAPHFLQRNVPAYGSFHVSHFLSLLSDQLRSVNDSGLRFLVRLEFLSDRLTIPGKRRSFLERLVEEAKEHETLSATGELSSRATSLANVSTLN